MIDQVEIAYMAGPLQDDENREFTSELTIAMLDELIFQTLTIIAIFGTVMSMAFQDFSTFYKIFIWYALCNVAHSIYTSISHKYETGSTLEEKETV